MFYPNLGFEEELVSDSFQPKGGTLRALNELAPLMAWAADEGDMCLVPELPSGSSTQCANMYSTSIADGSAADSFQLVPWGWTNHVIRMTQSAAAFQMTAPDVSVVSRINSRSFLHPFDRLVDISATDLSKADSRPFSCLCHTFDEVMLSANRLAESGWPKWIAKPEISHAGRNRLIMTGCEFNQQQKGWLKRVFGRGECVSVEPWVNVVSEGSLHFDVSSSGSNPPIRLVGITGLLNDQAGRYRGSFLPFAARPSVDFGQHLRQLLVDHGLEICQAAHSVGYFGPMGLDFFLFEDLDGKLLLRLCNDLNARWTMGRLSLAVANKVGANEAFRWEHFAAGNSTNLDFAIQKGLTDSGVRSVDILRTSPDHVGGRDVRLGNAAIWGPSSDDVSQVASQIRACLS